MARYDVYRNREGVGFLLDVQADIFDVIDSRIVVPLLPARHSPKPAARLTPMFRILDEDVVMLTPSMSAVPKGILKERIASLSNKHDTIVSALDMLFFGF